METKSKDGLLVLGTFALVVIGFMTWSDQRAKNRQEKAEEPAKLVALAANPIPPDGVVPAEEYIPSGQGMPTTIPLFNDGKREGLVKQLILSEGKWVATPNRQRITGAGKTVSVTFEPRHYVEKHHQYMLVLPEPAPVPGGQWTVLQVAILDPARVGRTFVGRVTVISDGMEQLHFKNVQIDVLKQLP